jgi:hypothetical protein
MANTYLQRTVSSAGNRKTFTYSAWVKRCSVDSTHYIVTQGADSSNNWTIVFDGANRLQTWNYVGGFQYNLKLTRLFRDTNAWYHIVLAVDTTQATASDRVKIYVNGVQQTSFVSGEDTYPSQNTDMYVNSTSGTFRIGYYTSGGSYFNGVMSHVHFCDGTALAPTVFGSTDSTTGEWKINTSPSFTPGTNGFTVLKDGNTITDQSANSNNFTVGGGTLTKTEDNPSNVFATLNPLAGSTDATFIAGNTTAYFGTASSRSILTSTLGAVSGKYYWECKIGGNVSPNNATLGVGLSSSYTADSNPVGYKSDSWGYKGWDGTVFNNSSSVGGTWSTFGDGDIIGVAVNLDNEQGGLNKLYFSKNGVWQNGADPSNFTSVTGVVGITKPENGDTGFLFAQFGDGGSSATPRFEVNFGNGFFQQTAVSSAGTNASGIGIFEYDVPTGFTALSTKGLNL